MTIAATSKITAASIVGPKNMNPSDEELRTTALGLCRFAYDYIEAARVVDTHQGAGSGYERVSSMPAYFLAMHGIELTLKAFLRYRQISAQSLRSQDFKHDLRKCYRKAKELGLRNAFRMSSADIRAMLLLIQLNEYQGLRYIRTGLKRFPSWAIVEPFAVRLHQAVAPLVGCRTFSITYHTDSAALPLP